MTIRQISKVGITARQTLRVSTGFFFQQKGHVVIKRLRRIYKNEHIEYLSETRTTELGQPVRNHFQRVSIINVGPAFRASQRRIFLKIQCDCEAHEFFCEVALYRIGAADIIYSNGDRPIERNPRMIPICCKHIFLVLQTLLRKQK